MPLKSIFSLVSTAGDMLAGAQSQIMAVGHVKCIKLTLHETAKIICQAVLNMHMVRARQFFVPHMLLKSIKKHIQSPFSG